MRNKERDRSEERNKNHFDGCEYRWRRNGERWGQR